MEVIKSNISGETRVLVRGKGWVSIKKVKSTDCLKAMPDTSNYTSKSQYSDTKLEFTVTSIKRKGRLPKTKTINAMKDKVKQLVGGNVRRKGCGNQHH